MIFLLLAFFAGVITVFAPCVFALLPVIVGGSMSGDVHDKRRPFIISISLAVSLIVFTLLLKATTLFINVPPTLITSISGVIIILLGFTLLFPNIYDRIIIALNLQAKSQQLLSKSGGKGAVVGAIITGAALGPVFSSCSPVYGYILATVLPVNFGVAMAYMLAYVLGLSSMLLLVGFLGQKIVRRLKWASNPRGWFTRIVSVLFIIVGLLIITGYDKKFQTYVAEHTFLDFDGLSSKLIPASGNSDRKQIGGVLNVSPYKAPELTGISTWINSKPLKVSELKGKVVLIDFWTYSCINCIRTQPYLKDLYAKYHDAGLEIIGVHAPEFSFEKNPDNVRNAVKDAGLKYPIAMDNDLLTWAAYDNQYWPASYFIDKDGQIRRTHFGEGGYAENEEAIRQLLAEKGGTVPGQASTMSDNAGSTDITPETYLGFSRAGNFVGDKSLTIGESAYTPKDLTAVNQWTLGGTWNESKETLTAVKDSVLKFRIKAKDVFLVTGNGTMAKVDVLLNGKPISQTNGAGSDIKDSQFTVSMPQLYKIVHFDKYQSDFTVELRVPAGVQLNSFTFGG